MMNPPHELSLHRKDSREAADAGVLLWRENFVYFILFFAIPFWICAFSLRILTVHSVYLAWIIMWLLKPLFDRLILQVISVRFFESDAGIKRIWRGLGKTMLRGLAGDLTWRRFSPLRAAMLPVRALETHGKSRMTPRMISERKNNLKNGGINYCSLLSIWGVALEITLLFGEIVFFIIMSDLLRPSFSDSFWDSIAGSEVYIFAAWCFNYMLIETLYVCMGFSLYINSRIEVEGWDIEIMFRGFAKKLMKKGMNAAIIVFFLLCLFSPVKAFATDQEAASEIPMESLQNILDSPDFGGEKASWGIRLKNPGEPKEIPYIKTNPVFEKLRETFAGALRLILIIFIAGMAVILFFFFRKSIYVRKKTEKDYSARVLQKHSVENPEQLLDRAIAFFEQGNLRLAWGCCTAAAVISWSFYRGLSFPPDATEIECADKIASCGAGEAPAFKRLIDNWINFVYAGQLPQMESFEEAVNFCKAMRGANG